MTSKEALKILCEDCEKSFIKDGFLGCPFKCISHDYCDEIEIIKKDLYDLELIRKRGEN